MHELLEINCLKLVKKSSDLLHCLHRVELMTFKQALKLELGWKKFLYNSATEIRPKH